MLRSKFLFVFIIAVFVFQWNSYAQNKGSISKVWSTGKANEWYKAHTWLTGSNYIPANAINQLEMWQADTFDPITINKELGWAEALGFNTMRVFLHSLAYKQDPKGFKSRMNDFLKIASSHHIQPLFVFFDDCWNESAQIGKQPLPKTGVHNSGWLQDPGSRLYKDSLLYNELEVYVKDVLGSFKHDKRILFWDLYNEPGNRAKKEVSFNLLKRAYSWARTINPDQPVTVGLWSWKLEEMNTFIVANSDIITYHNYDEPKGHLKVVQILKTIGRPVICTEYMARTHNSRFNNVMPVLKEENVGAINWGFVSGKTNTIYSWEKAIPDGTEPKEWFHDIYRIDGTPYRQEEIEVIKKLNGKM